MYSAQGCFRDLPTPNNAGLYLTAATCCFGAGTIDFVALVDVLAEVTFFLESYSGHCTCFYSDAASGVGLH